MLQATHPAPCLDTLVNKIREGFPGDVAPGAFGDMKGAVFQDNLPLADDHQRRATALHAFKDVVLESLQEEGTGHLDTPCHPGQISPGGQHPLPNITWTKERPRAGVPVPQTIPAGISLQVLISV